MQLGYLAVVVIITLFGNGQCICPEGWTDRGGLCWSFRASPATWDNAESMCTTKGGHLADIVSSDENAIVTAFRQAQNQTGDPVWLGMRPSVETGPWHWLDGSLLTWTSWVDGLEPSTSSNPCGTLETDGSNLAWSSKPCNFALAFICRYKDPQPPVSETNTKPESAEYGNWWKAAEGGHYTGPGAITAVTSPSSIGCVIRCESTKTCDAVVFDLTEHECLLVTGGAAAAQLAGGEESETWVRRTNK